MKKVFIFLAGAAVESFVTWKLIDHKYAELANKEIESVVDTFKKEKEKILGTVESIYNRHETSHITSTEDAQKKLAQDIIDNNSYSVGVDMAENESVQVEETEFIDQNPDDEEYEDEEQEDVRPFPYIIKEDEYGEFGNEEQTLIFYEDGILADEEEDVVTDPESLIGDALVEFANDPLLERVYVRNERLEVDYIILKSEKSYKEVYGDTGIPNEEE